jgi:ADP-ribose pyrophosphatase YjhB (NUDIX family)
VADQIRTRPTARVALLDPDDRLLMLRIHDPAAMRSMKLPTPDFWLLPGGGVKPGENYEDAALREVFEETGISDVVLGPCVWTADYTAWWWHDGQPMHGIERYYVARVPAGLAVNFDRHEPLEASTTIGYRWFTLDEVVEREAAESFRPPGLAKLLRNLLGARSFEDFGEPLALSLD